MKILLCTADGASTYLDMINNKDVSADCDPSTKQCNIQIQGFPIQLQTPCQAGDCISEKNPTLNSGEPEYLIGPEKGILRMPAFCFPCLLQTGRHESMHGEI